MRKPETKFCSDDVIYQTAMRAIHDFRAPMRALAASHEMIRGASGDSDALEPALHFSDVAQRRITALLDGLAAYVEVTMQDFDISDISIQGLVDDAWESARTVAPNHAVQLETDALPSLFADKEAVTRVLRHLFENAILYSQKQERVTVHVTAQKTPHGTELIVKDDGPGIEDRYAQRIFDPMFRLVAKSDVEGAGLGLSICEKIMQGHQGHVSLAPSADTGATFLIFFPDSGKF